MSNNNRRSTGHYQQQRGFSLVELMTVIALISVLIAMAGPSFRGAVDRSRIRSTTQDLMASLSAARSKALSQNRQIMVRSYANNVNWDTAVVTTHPNGGWCVMPVDTSSVQTTCTSSAGFPIYESHEVDKNVTVVASATSLIFDGGGAPKSGAVTFTVCKSKNAGNTITVGAGGRITSDAAVCP